MYFCRAAELLNSLPNMSNDSGSETDPDSPLDDTHDRKKLPVKPSQNKREARLEAREYHRFLLAKSFYDCREYDRCAAVFLPSTRPQIPIPAKQTSPSRTRSSQGKDSLSSLSPPELPPASYSLGELSQKALFLAVYAKYLG